MREPQPDAATWLRQGPAYVHLIALNVAVFFLLLFLDGPKSGFVLANFFVSPGAVLEDYRVWTLVTSAFTHLDLMHIGLNMILLYVMGQILQGLGWTRADQWTLYLVAGVCGSLAFCGLGALRGTWTTPAIGASGAIYGFLIAGAVAAPNRVLLLMGVLPMPLWGLAVAYTALDILGVSGQLSPDRVAHSAHLGGAVVGLLVAHFNLRPSKRRARPPRLKVLEGGGKRTPAPEPPAQPIAPAPPVVEPPRVDNATALQVDELLRKIKRDGLSSLTDEERKFLEQASRRYQ